MRTWQLNGYSIKELNIEDRPVPKINNNNLYLQILISSINLFNKCPLKLIRDFV